MRHRDGAHDAGEHAVALERVLECEGVHDRREHPHVVRLRTIHARRGRLQPAEDVASTNNDGELDTKLADGADLASE